MAYRTVNEVAELLRVTPLTVRRWLKSGELQGFPLGTRAGWRISDEAIAEFIATRERSESGQVPE